MILTPEFCASQPRVTLTVTNQDGSVVTDSIMAGSCGLFAGMVQDAIRNPVHKAALDRHIGYTRFALPCRKCGWPHIGAACVNS